MENLYESPILILQLSFQLCHFSLLQLAVAEQRQFQPSKLPSKESRKIREVLSRVEVQCAILLKS